MYSTIQCTNLDKSAAYRTALEDIVERCFVLNLRGSDEGIIGNIEAFPELLKLWGEFVAVGLWIDTGLRGSLLDLLTMFIKTGEEEDIASAEAPIACKYICGNGGVGVTDVRHIVDVIDRGRDVEPVLVVHGSTSKDTRSSAAKARQASDVEKGRWLRSRVAQRLNVQIGKELLWQLGVGG